MDDARLKTIWEGFTHTPLGLGEMEALRFIRDEATNRRPSPAAGADYVVVPREPSDEMVNAGCKAWYGAGDWKYHHDKPGSREDMRDAYRAMLAAAPAQPAPKDDGRLPDRECFWLIERKVSPPQYIREWNDLTMDPFRARRWTTERAAHDHWRTMNCPWRDECSVVEHVFINKIQPAPIAAGEEE